jgi:hypothetical protein
VWLFAHITTGNTKQVSQKLYDLKRIDEQVRVYPTEKDQYEKWDVLLPKSLA